MGPRLRKMKPYYPRRKRSKSYLLQKQALKDLEHRMKTSVSSLLLCLEQGNPQQFEVEKLKVRSEFHKHGDEMSKLALDLGQRYTSAVKHFLESVDTIIHTEASWVDQEKVRQCYQATQALEKEIQAA